MAQSGPRLKFRDASGDERIVPLLKDGFKIGRMGENDLKIHDPFVSRVHAEITRNGDQFSIKDLNSKSGTFVNGVRIEFKTLSHGDRIQLSQNEFPELTFLTGIDISSGDQFSSSVQSTSFFDISDSGSTSKDLQHVSKFLERVRQFSSGVPLNEILDVVLDIALDITRAERGFIVLLDDSKKLKFQRGRNRKKENLNEDQFRVSSTVLQKVIDSGTKQIMSGADDEIPKAESIAALELRTVVCLPLRQAQSFENSGLFNPKANILGAMYLDSRKTTAVLSTISEGLLESLANDAGAVLMNARLLGEAREKEKLEFELNTAREIQESLLPEICGTYETFEAFAQNSPSRTISGDYYDLIQLSDGRTAFVIADISGKGVSAAILTSLVQGVLFAEISRHENLLDSILNVNRFLVSRSNMGKFVSLFIGILHPGGTLTYINAGHNPPFLVRNSGECIELEARGMVLGIIEQAVLQQRSIELQTGDVLCLYTDGVTEAHAPGGELFGEDRLRTALITNRSANSENILKSVINMVTAHTADHPRSDDLTLLIVKYL
jgi:serine phosphatase RsbU (regulator of sigma subunit)/pSer/pThr/pTyr-binding forkhead associated (FHA) protein